MEAPDATAVAAVALVKEVPFDLGFEIVKGVTVGIQSGVIRASSSTGMDCAYNAKEA